MFKNLKAFTLVELIVVVTILGVLSTIGFVSYSSYLEGVRDSNRISQLVSIHDGLEMYRTTNELPLPDDYIEVYSSGTLIAYQGYAGKNVLESIEYTSEGKDPKDGSYFTYYLTEDKDSFQLLALLENQEELYGFNSQTFAANDYSSRSAFVVGDKLGVLTDENKTPVQELSEIVTAGKIEIKSISDLLISHFRKGGSLKAPGTDLGIMEYLADSGGKPNNCLTWILMNPELQGTDGVYQLTDTDGKNVQGYCDWLDSDPIPDEGNDEYELVSSGAITNGDFEDGDDIPTATGSTEENTIIEVEEDEVPEEIESGHVIEQEGDDSDYEIEIEDNDTDGDGKTEQEEFEELDDGDVVRMCGWVRDLDEDGYIFNNIVDYYSGKRSYNGRLFKKISKIKKGKKWEYHCVEHRLVDKPKTFKWKMGYRAERWNKNFYAGNLEVRFYKKRH